MWRAIKRDGVSISSEQPEFRSVDKFLKVGRLLVASRDIRPWEAVIEDNAVVVAPGDHPLCILCLGDLGGEGRSPSTPSNST